MTHALITGAAGFIGSHLVRHLLATTDWTATALVGLTYADDAGALPRSPRLTLLYHDLRAAVSDRLAERIGPVDYVINLASESHVDRSIAEPAPFVLNNVSLILNVLEYARQARPWAVFHLSTDEVFGPAPDGTAFGEWDATLPSNPYAASKAAQDALCVAYWRTYNVPLILGRSMNNYGPGQHPEKLVPKATRLLLQGRPVPIHAGLTPGGWVAGSRTWLHARNTSDAVLFLLKNLPPVFFPDAERPQAVNISGDVELSNLEVVERIAEALSVPPLVSFVDFHGCRPGHDRRYALDGSKLRSLGWVPPLGFERSFRDTVASYAGA